MATKLWEINIKVIHVLWQTGQKFLSSCLRGSIPPEPSLKRGRADLLTNLYRRLNFKHTDPHCHGNENSDYSRRGSGGIPPEFGIPSEKWTHVQL